MFLDDLSVGDFICCNCNRRWDTHSRCVIRVGDDVRPVCRDCFALSTGQALVNPQPTWPQSPFVYGAVRASLFAACVVVAVALGIVAGPLLLALFGLNSIAGRARF